MAVFAGPPILFHKFLYIALSVIVLLGILVNFLQLSSDPHRCRGILTNGTWLNPVRNGTRLPLDNWQPEGCMLHKYTAEDIHDCFEGRHVVFAGDSTTRQVYWATARILDKALADKTRPKLDKHSSYDLEFDGVRMVFHWNPFMSLNPKKHNETAQEIALYRDQILNPQPVVNQSNAATIFLGVGPWFAEKNITGEYPGMLTQLADSLPHEGIPMVEDMPMSDEDGIGPQVFFAPPVPPRMDDSNTRKVKMPPGEMRERVLGMRGYLEEHAEESNLLLIRSIPELFRNEWAVTVDPGDTGFHVIDSVAMVKANLFLNARCNAKLDRVKGYPYDRTCCTDYGRLTFPQLLLVSLGAVYVALCVTNEIISLRSSSPAMSAIFSLDIGIFVTALLGCYWADRTQAFPKGNKQFTSFSFMCLLVPVVILACATLSKSTPPRPRPGQAEPLDAEPIDTKPLSRDQTDEWKGWMQAVILIYHWTGASRVLSIYIFVRLLVAAYLFQSGFGHAVYFITKRDFSFKRVASVLLRLNLLACALSYIMNTDYMFYYFAPLISFWYLIIYAVFAVMPHLNDGIGLYAKMAVAVVICPGIMISTPITSWIFSVLSVLFNIHWDLHEWQFRLTLDGFIVYIGMLTGIASVQSPLYNTIFSQTKGLSGLIGLLTIYLYYYASTTLIPFEKTAYNTIHPYVSAIPVLAFIALRNFNSPARQWYSRSMAWLGRCSLETFTLQFHIFLAGDTKGVLLLDFFTGGDGNFVDRARSLWIIVPIFLYISSSVAEATGELVKIITSPANNRSADALDAFDRDLESNDADMLTLLRKEGVSMAWLQSLNASSVAKRFYSDLRVRIGGMLLLMWVLNLL